MTKLITRDQHLENGVPNPSVMVMDVGISDVFGGNSPFSVLIDAYS